MSRKAAVLRHVTYEGLDALEPILVNAGYNIEYIDVPEDKAFAHKAEDADLLVILGGPMGVYEADQYPFLHGEIEVVEQRLVRELPVLGLCLGAQIIAAALGAKVYRGEQGRERGWHTLHLTEAGHRSALAPLNQMQVFQWHQDTFDLPQQAVHLARTDTYENQAFSVGQHVLALQFHLEVSAPGLERWFEHLGKKSSNLNFDLKGIRRQTVRAAPKANLAAVDVLEAYLAGRTLIGGMPSTGTFMPPVVGDTDATAVVSTSHHAGKAEAAAVLLTTPARSAAHILPEESASSAGTNHQEAAMSDSLENRVTDLEVKLSFAEDMLDRLNETIVKQQRQIEVLAREVMVLRDQIPEVDGRTPHEPGDEIPPPHY